MVDSTPYLNQTLAPVRVNDMKGEAPFILASLEMEGLAQDGGFGAFGVLST